MYYFSLSFWTQSPEIIIAGDEIRDQDPSLPSVYDDCVVDRFIILEGSEFTDEALTESLRKCCLKISEWSKLITSYTIQIELFANQNANIKIGIENQIMDCINDIPGRIEITYCPQIKDELEGDEILDTPNPNIPNDSSDSDQP